MARRIILKENSIGTSNPPSGYRYIGYNGTNIVEKTTTGESNIKSITMIAKHVTGNVSNSTTTLDDIIDLTFDIPSAGVWKVDISWNCVTAATTTGVGIGFRYDNNSNVTYAVITYSSSSSTAGGSTTGHFTRTGNTTVIQPTTSAPTIGASPTAYIHGSGVLRLAAAGTLYMQFRSEVAASNVTLVQGSCVVLTKID